MKSTNKRNSICGLLLLVLAFFPLSLSGKQPSEASIQFTVEHPLKTVEGMCRNPVVSGLDYTYDGQFQLKGPFKVTVPYKDMKTGNGNRDSHMMEVLGYPDHTAVVATITEAEPAAEGLRIAGALSINGVNMLFRTLASLKQDQGSIVISGTARIRLSDFHVERPSLLGMSVEDQVIISYRFKLPK